MLVDKARMSENGRIVVPAGIRKAMQLKGGEELTLLLDENGLHIQTIRQKIARAQAIARQRPVPGRSLVDELIAERREEAKREAAR